MHPYFTKISAIRRLVAAGIAAIGVIFALPISALAAPENTVSAEIADDPTPAALPWRVDAALAFGTPSALPVGQNFGFAVGGERRLGAVSLGVRGGWSQATEYTTTFAVTHGDWKLRAVAAAEKALGRGSFGLRAGVGGTLVHEVRVRDQASRIADGAALGSSIWRLAPAADLEITSHLRLFDAWGVVLSAGPTVTLLSSGSHFGWTSTLGLAWLP